MVITAEGVETAEQLELVRAVGCSEAQGYMIDKPQPFDEAMRIFKRERAVAAA